jgi:hypothetical protein
VLAAQAAQADHSSAVEVEVQADIQVPEGTVGQFVPLLEDLQDKAVEALAENGRVEPSPTTEEVLGFTEKDNPDTHPAPLDPAARINFSVVVALGSVTLEQAGVVVVLEFSGD